MKLRVKDFALLELLIITGIVILSAVYLVSPNRDKQNYTEQSPQPTPTTVQPTLIPLVTPRINQISDMAPSTIPADWTKYTDEDTAFGLKTSLSLPPGYIFFFTGSEWLISDENYPKPEIWDYTSSIFMGGDQEEPKNYYDGSSPWLWFQRNLDGEFFEPERIAERDLQIIEVNEYSFSDNRKYYQIESQYRSSGQVVTQYLYIQNGIVNIFTPINSDQFPNSTISTNFGPIFVSLTSQMVAN
jgi:hypothetical protein